MPPALFVVGETQQKKLHFGTFSDYVQDLVRRDAKKLIDEQVST